MDVSEISKLQKLIIKTDNYLVLIKILILKWEDKTGTEVQGEKCLTQS